MSFISKTKELWATSTGLFHHEMTHSFVDNQEIYLLFEMQPLIQGSRFVLFYGIITILAPIIAFYCSRKKIIKLPLAIGYLFVMVASILMATITMDDTLLGMPPLTMFFPSALAAIGLTAPLVLLRTVVQLCSPAHLTCFVTSLASFIRTLGIITGNIIINSRYNASLSQNFTNSMSELGISVEQSQDLFQALRMRNVDLLVDIASRLGVSQQALKVLENIADKAQMDSFRIVWIAVAVLAFLAAAGCIAMSTVNQNEPAPRSTPTITLPSDSMPRVGSVPNQEVRFSAVLDIRRDPEKPLFNDMEEIVKY
ncbi:hypothetical protein Clacol_009045 [Clathrus columnatus]|uniref:Uncharacterized protein n=1 Tax=Clathrus columnatus TaxID=1419009 RepID=A0AAV5AJG1_9AGAM|nr:hypothetical protein Clacol_009045 [Clathrus columnatus]